MINILNSKIGSAGLWEDNDRNLQSDTIQQLGSAGLREGIVAQQRGNSRIPNEYNKMMNIINDKWAPRSQFIIYHISIRETEGFLMNSNKYDECNGSNEYNR